MGRIIQPGENRLTVGVDTPEEVEWLQTATKVLPQILGPMLQASPSAGLWGREMAFYAVFNVLRILRETTLLWPDIVDAVKAGGKRGPFGQLMPNRDGPHDLPPPEGDNVESDVWLWRLAVTICSQPSEELAEMFASAAGSGLVGVKGEDKGNGEDARNDAAAGEAADADG